MDAMRMADVAARVVAWHNRHPLARRITPDDIGPVGIVALPFAVPAEPDAADGSAADPGRWRALFGAGWMYRAHRAMAARLPAWVRDHGVATPAGFDGWPRRQIDAELPLSHRADADGLTGRNLRHVLSTVVEGDGHRARVLVAPRAQGTRRAVFGARQWSLPRLFTAAGVAAGTLATLATLAAAPALDGAAHGAGAAASSAQVRSPSEPPAMAAATAAVASTAASTAAASPPVSALRPVAAASMPSGGAGPVAGPVADDARPARPTGRTATLAPAAERPVELRPRLSDADRRADRRAARAAGELERSSRATRAHQDALNGPAERPSPRATATPPAPSSAQATVAARSTGAPRPAARARMASPGPATTAAAVRQAGPMFAIATHALAARADAQAQEALMRGLVASQATPYPTQLELMESRGRWRAVWWPHPDRDHAEGLLLLARERGLRVELVEF